MSEERKYWLDDRKNIDKIVYTLYGICVLLVLADFFYEKHPHIDAEYWVGFYALYGFIAYTTLVLSAKGLRKFLKREEDYYGE